MAKKDSSLRHYWDEKNAKADSVRANGKAEITIERGAHFVNGGRVYVVCPNREEFQTGALNDLKGRYKYRTKRWTFSLARFREVEGLCIKVYGKGNVTIVGR